MITENLLSRIFRETKPVDTGEINYGKIRRVAERVARKHFEDLQPPLLSEEVIIGEGFLFTDQELMPLPSIGYYERGNPNAPANKPEKTIRFTTEKEMPGVGEVTMTRWKNFAGAHFLGHWFLHPNIEKESFDPSIVTDHQAQSKEEQEANIFGAYLLMSNNHFLNRYSPSNHIPTPTMTGGGMTPEVYLAAGYDVPVAVSELRKTFPKQ